MIKNTKWKKQIALFLVSQNISVFGSSLVGFSIIWYITLQTSSSVWVTISTMATLVPQVLISLWAGVLADRCSRKFIIMAADGFTALATLAAFIAFQTGYDSLPFLIFVSFLRSLGGGFQGPAVSAMYPNIVPQDQLVRINGINQTVSSILLLISPAAGGLILGTVGIKWTFLVDIVTALAAILIMSRLKAPQQDKKDGAGKTSIGSELKSGICYTWRHPLLRTFLICYGVTFILFTPASFLSPLMVARTFGDEVWRLTANEMLWTIGSLLGGAYVALRGDFKNKVTALSVSLSGFGIFFALMACSRSFWLFLLLDCICGMFLPILMTAQTVLIQNNTDPVYMGRVFSLLQFVSQGVMPVAMLCFGPLGDRVNIQYIIIVCGLLLALWGIWFKQAAERALIGASASRGS